MSCNDRVYGRSSTVIEHATLGAKRRVRQMSWSHIGRIRSCERSAPAHCGYQAHARWEEFAQERRRKHPGLGPRGLQGGGPAAVCCLISGPSRVCRSHAEWIGRPDATRPCVDDQQEERTRLKIVVSRVQVPVSPPPKSPAKRVVFDLSAGNERQSFWASKCGNRRLLAQLSRQQRPTWTLEPPFGGARKLLDAVPVGGRPGAPEPACSTTPGPSACGGDAR
jgi:hypothetical protein